MPNPIRSNPLSPQFRYDTRSGRYVDAGSGRFVKRAVVLNVVEGQIAKSRGAMEQLSRQLQAEQIDLVAWRVGMIQNIKTLHMAQYALGHGGWAKLTQADYGRMGSVLKRQYTFLNNFVTDMQAKYPSAKALDGRFITRAGMYANAGRATYEKSRQMEAYGRGMRYEKRLLEPSAQHCAGCLKEAARGWQPIFTLASIGSVECKQGCKCTKIFSKTIIK